MGPLQLGLPSLAGISSYATAYKLFLAQVNQLDAI